MERIGFDFGRSSSLARTTTIHRQHFSTHELSDHDHCLSLARSQRSSSIDQRGSSIFSFLPALLPPHFSVSHPLYRQSPEQFVRWTVQTGVYRSEEERFAKMVEGYHSTSRSIAVGGAEGIPRNGGGISEYFLILLIASR